MGREIKFWAWHKKKMAMFAVHELSLSSGNAWVSGNENWTTPPVFHKPDYELMQFTGLQDKNGLDIYEGDVFAIDTSIPPQP